MATSFISDITIAVLVTFAVGAGLWYILDGD